MHNHFISEGQNQKCVEQKIKKKSAQGRQVNYAFPTAAPHQSDQSPKAPIPEIPLPPSDCGAFPKELDHLTIRRTKSNVNKL